MGIWRLSDTGAWQQVKKLYRLSDAGTWVAIKNAWRLSNAGIWETIYSALSNPSAKSPDVPKLYFVDPSNFATTDLAYSTYKMYLTRGKWTQDPLTFEMKIQRSTSVSFTSPTNIISETKTYTTYSDSNFEYEVPLNTANRPTLTNTLIRNGNYYRGYVKATNEDNLFGEYFTPTIKPRIDAQVAFAKDINLSIAFSPTANGATFSWNYSGFESIVAADVFSQTLNFYPQGNTSGTPIYTQSVSPGTSTTAAPTTSVVISNTALQPNTSYTVTLTAVMNDLWKTESSSLQTLATDFGDFTTAADKPAKPVITSATDVGTNRPYNNGAVSLVWTQPTGGATVTGYKIEYSVGPNYLTINLLVSNTGNTSTSGTFTGLDANKNYKFYVTALSASSSSDISDPSSIVFITTVPDKPTGVYAIAGNASADVYYNAVSASNNGGKSISEYRATSSPGSITGTEIISPIPVTGLTNYVDYTFTVAARNNNGYSAESTASAAVTPKLPAPVGSGSVTIALNSPSNYIYQITSYGTWSNSSTSYDYEWQTSSDGGTSWTTVSSGTAVATIPNYNASSYKTQKIQLLVYGRNQTGRAVSPLTSNQLTIFYTTPIINSFSVSGSELAVSYTYTYTADDPGATTSLEYKLSSSSDIPSNWTQISLLSNPNSVPLSAGTYDFRFYVINSVINGATRIAVASQSNIVVSNIYSFSFGNSLYPSTNGYIGLTNFSTLVSLPTTGKFLSIYGGDFIGNTNASPYMEVWSDSTKYVIMFDGYQLGFLGQAAYRLTWQATFYSNQQYIDVKIIRKGASVSGINRNSGIYNNGNLVAGLPGPYTLSAGTTFRINLDGSTGSFGITYDEITDTAPNDIMAAAPGKTGTGDDDVYYNITTAQNVYKSPVVTIGTISGSTNTLSIPFTESSGCDYVTYTVRTGSYSGTIIQSSSALSGPINLSSLSANTTYYITLTPFNYKNQSGSIAQTTATTAPPAPTVTFSSITSSSFTASWSATGATHYYIDIYNTNTLVSLSGYPLTNTTSTSASPFGLSAGTSYTVLAYSKNTSNGFLSTSTVSSVTTLLAGLTPTFGTNTSQDNAFTGSVTNYDANYSYNTPSVASGTLTAGTFTWGTQSGSTRPFTVSSLTDGQSSTVTITTSRSGYGNASNSTTGTANLAALTPSFNTPTSVSGGFTGSMTNYNSSYSYNTPSVASGTLTAGTFTWGTPSGSTWPYTVSGLTSGQSSTATVAAARVGYKTGVNSVTGSASSNVAPSGGVVGTPTLSSGTAGRVGAVYAVNITTEATGTPAPTKSYQWQYYSNADSTWYNITGATFTTYTIPYTVEFGSVDVPGRRIRCQVTWTNSEGSFVRPLLTDTTTGFITVDLPTVTNVVSYYYSTASRTATKGSTFPIAEQGYPIRPPTSSGGTFFVVWYVEGYNMQGMNSRTLTGTSSSVTTVQAGTTTSDSQNIYSSSGTIGDGTFYAGGIYRNTGAGANGQWYALRIEPTSRPQGLGSVGQRKVTNAVQNSTTNQTNSPITNTLTDITSAQFSSSTNP